MFEEMSEVYQEIAKKPIHVEDLIDRENLFAFFVAYSASVTLTSISYSKIGFMEFIKNFRLTSLQPFGSIKNNDKLNKTEKKIIDFFEKINQINNYSEEDTESILENTIKYEIFLKDLKYPEILSKNPPPEDFKNISFIEINAICHSFYIIKDLDSEIDWKNPPIQTNKINSKIKLDLSPFSKGEMRYFYYMYDSFLDQNLIASLPIKYKNQKYNLEFLSKEIESLIVSEHIACEFNDRIINHRKNTYNLLLNFKRAYIYELNLDRNIIIKENSSTPEDFMENFFKNQIIKNNYNLFCVENYIEGSYEKNKNSTWTIGDMNKSTCLSQAFSHFTWQYTKGYLIIEILQGVEEKLIDPQIHYINNK